MASVELMKNSKNVHSPPDQRTSEDSSNLHFSKVWNLSKKKSLEVTETNNGVKVQTDKPHLVSLGGGRLSTAVTLLPLPKGKTTIGSSSTQTIVIQGTGIDKEHCIIENNDGIVTLYPLATMVAVDGHIISKPTILNQGSMICLGRSNYFRFNHPEEAQFMKSLLPNTRISVAPINFEAQTDFPTKTNGFKQPAASPVGQQSISPVAMLSSLSSRAEKRDQPIHLYRDELESEDFVEKVSKFEYLAHSQQKPVTSDPNRWFVRDGITHRSVSMSSSSSSSSSASSSVPSPNSFLGPNKPFLPSEALGTSYSTPNSSQAPVKSVPRAGSNVHASLVLGSRTASGSNATGLSKLPLLPKIDARISPKVFVPMKVPAATEKPPTVSHRHTPTSSYGDQVHHPALEDLESYQKQLEEQHQKVMKERIQEQELEQQEQQRLEEILNMCAEYERQTMKESKSKPSASKTTGHAENIAMNLSSLVDDLAEAKESIADSIKLSPSHGVHMNRIKTNGSLPRDKFTKPFSPGDSPNSETGKTVKYTSSEDELNRIFNLESPLQSPTHYQRRAAAAAAAASHNAASYSTYPQSPRTQIRTVINKEKREEIYENHAIIKDYQRQQECRDGKATSQMQTSKSSSAFQHMVPSKATSANAPVKLKPSAEELVKKSNNLATTQKSKNEEMAQEMVALRQKRNLSANNVTELKRRAMNLDTQENEAVRELDVELALLDGEHQEQLSKSRQNDEKILALKMKERELNQKAEIDRELEKSKIENSRLKLELAESKLRQLEDSLDIQPEGSPERERLVQEIMHQHEIVDIEKKNFEDLEFQQLENEAHREEEREQIVYERTQTEVEHATRLVEIKELEKQKEEMKKQIQKEVNNIQTERQTLLAYYQKEKELLHSIDMKLQLCQIGGISNPDSEANSKSSSEDENDVNFGLSPPESSCSPIHKCPDDLIHHVTSTSPILIKDDSIGEKVSATLKKIDQNRQLILEKEGGLVIEKERRRVQELKKRAADEVRSQWEEKKQREANCNSFNSVESEASSVTSSDILPESLSSEEYATDKMTDIDACPSSPDERLGELRHVVQQRDAGLEQMLEETRPLSEQSSQDDYEVKFRDRLHVKQQRPLTRYLPIRRDDFNLIQHIASSGHQIELCPCIRLTNTTCRGYLHKLGTKFRSWNKRWFVFDRSRRLLLYYTDKSEGKARGRISFQYIVDVYVDHLHSVKSPNPELMFCLKTIDRIYHLMAPSAEAMRIWIDVIFTGAEGYQEFS